jgi:5'-3' exonuclease
MLWCLAKRDLVENYVRGLYWVLRYYHKGVGSWGWYYPFLYAPLASDLVNLASVNVTFSKGAMLILLRAQCSQMCMIVGTPFSPLLQLLSVLPPQSAEFLPTSYKELMMSEASPVAQFYPKYEFEIRYPAIYAIRLCQTEEISKWTRTARRIPGRVSCRFHLLPRMIC